MSPGGGGPVRLVGLSNAAVASPTLDCQAAGRAVNIVNGTADVLLEK